MNLLFKASESFDNFQGKLVEKLAATDFIDKLVVISRSSDIPKNIPNVVEYSSSIGWNYQYRYTEEYKESEPLSREILEKIQPFLATAIAIATRDTNFDIYSVFEARMLVYITVRYWYHIIKKNNVNYMLFSYIPHTLHEYAIYLLGKALDIPMLVYSSTHIPYISVWGDSIKAVGDNIGRYFRNNCNVHDKTIHNKENEIGKNVSSHIENQFLLDFLNKQRNTVTPVTRTKKELKNARKHASIEINRYIKPRAILSHYYHLLLGHKDYNKEAERKYFRDLIRSIKWFFKQKSVSYYDKHATYPDYSVPYVYFGLQLTPEATTLPMGGVFDEQLLSVKILAEAAKSCGVKVYVKEHYVQSRRDAYFYDELFKIDNVVCIKTEVASTPLVESALAVSTQTGSCIIEGFIRKKHSLVFGDCYYWKCLPGLHVINDVKQCEALIQELLNGTSSEKITDEIVEQYFAAIDKNCITYLSYGTYMTQEARSKATIDYMVDNAYKNYIKNIQESIQEYIPKEALV